MRIDLMTMEPQYADRRVGENREGRVSAHRSIGLSVIGHRPMQSLITKRLSLTGPSIYDVHTEGDMGSSSGGRGEGRQSPMWTSTQKIKITVHWRHPVFSCKEVGVFFYQNFVFGRNKKWKFFSDIN